MTTCLASMDIVRRHDSFALRQSVFDDRGQRGCLRAQRSPHEQVPGHGQASKTRCPECADLANEVLEVRHWRCRHSCRELVHVIEVGLLHGYWTYESVIAFFFLLASKLLTISQFSSNELLH